MFLHNSRGVPRVCADAVAGGVVVGGGTLVVGGGTPDGADFGAVGSGV